MKIVAGSSSKNLAKRISEKTKIEMANIFLKRFPDGECYVRIDDEFDHAIIVQNTYPDENIVELFLIQDAVSRFAKEIDMVIPYYGYGRQDKIFEKGEAISAEKIAKLIEESADRIILVNPHKEHIKNFFGIEVNICDATPSIAKYFDRKVDVVISPDEGAIEIAKKCAEILNCDYHYFRKKRLSENEVIMELKDMNVEGKRALVLDDIISTGGTMKKAIEMLKNQGAKEIYTACIHGLFIANADEKILNAGCNKIVSTDTIETKYSEVSVANEISKYLYS
ncbi:MAG: ribose-phosphate diphosphokinase [Thermoplasmatales archaeon]|nr:ribose-phosphate diphosphokinase [Thermoplasmatales archaeon]